MGALTFDALLKSLKRGAADPVYYLHGDEDVLKDEAIRALFERVLEPSAREFNIDQRSAAELDPEAFSVLVNTAPLLSAMRAVVLRGVEQVRKTSRLYKELIHYLEAPNPSTLLVLVQGAGGDEKPDPALLAGATAVRVEPLPPDRALRWVARRARELGLALEDEAAPLLLDAVGPDLGALGRELDKLAAATGGRRATAADVAAFVGVRRGETLTDLVAAALERHPVRAAALVEPVLQQAGMTGVKIVTALGTALVGTALGRAELDRGVAAGRLPDVLFRHLLAGRPFGVRDWKGEAARWARWAARWDAAGLRQALRQALAADRALKSTTVSDEGGIVTDLVLTLAVSLEEAA
jgi:DNA polymerase-3 subunit delta